MNEKHSNYELENKNNTQARNREINEYMQFNIM